MELIPKMSVTVRKLEKNLFPPGLRFFGDQMSFRSKMPPGSHPVVVHNNYVIGHSKKVKRFEHFNLWFVREEQPGVYVCKHNMTITIPNFSPQYNILIEVFFLSVTQFLLQR